MMIIVSGLPGSGKTYFASRLAKQLDATYISTDLTRKSMDAMGQYAFEDKLNVYEQMARKAGESLRHGEKVVVDGTFYKQEMRDLFITLATLLHQPVHCILIVAKETLIKKRLSQPRLHSEADFSVYELVRPQYDPVEMDHLVLESKDDNIDAMVKKAVDYITKVDAGA